MPTLEKLWGRTAPKLRSAVGNDAWLAWFGSLQPTRLMEGGCLEFTVPTSFLRSWLETRYAPQILTAIRSEAPHVQQVTIRTRPLSSVSKTATRPHTVQSAKPAEPAVPARPAKAASPAERAKPVFSFRSTFRPALEDGDGAFVEPDHRSVCEPTDVDVDVALHRPNTADDLLEFTLETMSVEGSNLYDAIDLHRQLYADIAFPPPRATFLRECQTIGLIEAHTIRHQHRLLRLPKAPIALTRAVSAFGKRDGISFDHVTSDARTRRIQRVRYAAISVTWRTTLVSQSKIGTLLNRDHSTIIHAHKSGIPNLVCAEPELGSAIHELAYRIDVAAWLGEGHSGLLSQRRRLEKEPEAVAAMH